MLAEGGTAGACEGARESGTAAVTYVPRYDAFLDGRHASVPNGRHLPEMPVFESGPMKGSFYDPRCDNPAQMELIETYSRLLLLRRERPHLDPMFEPDPSTRYGSGNSYIAGAPTVTRFGSWQLQERAEKTLRSPTSSRASLEDALSAGLFSAGAEHLIRTERKALAALQRMPYRYQKSAGAGKRFGAKIPADNCRERISYADVFGGLMDCTSEFFHAFGQQILCRFACSLNTAVRIARDIRMGPDAVRRADRTGMLEPFPGMDAGGMVVSDACPDDVIYAVSAPNLAMLMADGPKIVSQDGSGGHIVRDFCGYAYECAPGAQSGCAIDLAS